MDHCARPSPCCFSAAVCQSYAFIGSSVAIKKGIEDGAPEEPKDKPVDNKESDGTVAREATEETKPEEPREREL